MTSCYFKNYNRISKLVEPDYSIIPSENRFCLMRKSRFQKQYKQKKSPQRPQCHK